MIQRFEQFSAAISEISRCWHKIAGEEMEKRGLKGPYAVYLSAMHRYPQGITAAQLAERCSRDKADISRAVSELEKKGMVTRESTNANGYRALLKLTDAGAAVAEFVNSRACLAVELGGQGISPEDRTVFYATLEHIAANLQRLSDQGLPTEKGND